MKRIFSFLLAIITLVGTTGIITSCQEDAPEINYTINITVNNDFTEVVNAINNGTVKMEAAVASLTAAINKMNGDQAAKLQALIDAVGTMATTLEAKLAVIEAAIKAETLALETKLALVEAAIKAMPDYSDKLAAIETAIKNLPDYSEKMDAIAEAIKNAPDYTEALAEIKDAIAAMPDYTEQLASIVTAIEALPDYSKQLEAISAAVEALPDYSEKFEAIQVALAAIAENIKAQEGQYADAFEALTGAVDAIAAAVEAGTLSQEEALAQIIALLESGALAGGEGEGEDTTPYITFTTNETVGAYVELKVSLCESQTVSEDMILGLENITIETDSENSENQIVKGNLTTNEVRINGDIDYFYCVSEPISSIDLSNAQNLLDLQIVDTDITSLDISKNIKLEQLRCQNNKLISLDASKNVNLSTIYCFYNQLTSLDFSQNKNLEELSCHDNQLTSLLVSSEGVGIRFLSIYYNQLDEDAMTALIESLPNADPVNHNFFMKWSSDEGNVVTDSHRNAARAKGYRAIIHDGSDWVE